MPLVQKSQKSQINSDPWPENPYRSHPIKEIDEEAPFHRFGRVETDFDRFTLKPSLFATANRNRYIPCVVCFDPESFRVRWTVDAVDSEPNHGQVGSDVYPDLLSLCVTKDLPLRRVLAAPHNSGRGGQSCSIIWMWDAETGAFVASFDTNLLNVKRLLAHQRTAFAGGSQGVGLYDLETFLEVTKFRPENDQHGTFSMEIESLAMSATRQAIFAGSRNDCLMGWDMRSGEQILRVPAPGCMGYYGCSLADDLNLLFGGRTGGLIDVFDLRKLKSAPPIHSFQAHQKPRSGTYFWVYDIDRLERDVFVSASEQASLSVWKVDGSEIDLRMTRGLSYGVRVWTPFGVSSEFFGAHWIADFAERFEFVLEGGDVVEAPVWRQSWIRLSSKSGILFMIPRFF